MTTMGRSVGDASSTLHPSILIGCVRVTCVPRQKAMTDQKREASALANVLPPVVHNKTSREYYTSLRLGIIHYSYKTGFIHFV